MVVMQVLILRSVDPANVVTRLNTLLGALVEAERSEQVPSTLHYTFNSISCLVECRTMLMTMLM